MVLYTYNLTNWFSNINIYIFRDLGYQHEVAHGILTRAGVATTELVEADCKK
jgi:hypothetical protein